MSHFREILQCAECGKIYRSFFFPTLHSINKYAAVCGRCGAKNKLNYVAAKPKLFGLKGWEIKGGE